MVGQDRRLRAWASACGRACGLGGWTRVTPLRAVSRWPLPGLPRNTTKATTAPATTSSASTAASRILLRTGWRARKAALQCANATGHGRWVALVALVACGVAAAAQGPVTTDEPGSFPAAFAARSYAPGRAGLARALGPRSARDGAVLPRRAREEARAARRRPPRRPGRPGADGRLAQDARAPHPVAGRAGSTSRASRPPTGGSGYAVYVLRPRRLGSSRVAIVEPTNTWQAYNFRDVDGERRRRHLVREPLLQRRRPRRGRSCATASRRTSATTTSASCAGSPGPATRRTSSPTTTSSG